MHATECVYQQSAGLGLAGRYREKATACVDDKLCLPASGGEDQRYRKPCPSVIGIALRLRSSAGAEACMPIEADHEAVSPARAAAGDGRGRLAEGERAF